MSKELCHICFETSNLHFIFEEGGNSENLTIAEKIKEISDVEISNSEDLPQFVCTECLQKIDNFIEFKSQIKSSHEYFQIIKWEVSEDALEIEELDTVPDQSVHAAVEGNFELDITEVNKSELLEETVTNGILNEDDLRNTKRKELQCTICGRFLSTKYRLKSHLIRLHTGEKPYKCDECQKSFAESNELKGHQRLHRGENFACSTCNKAFISNRGLNNHLKIHTGHVREGIHVYRETFKRKVCEDALEIGEPDSVQNQTVYAAVEGNCELDITEVNKSELLEETVKSSKLNENDLINSITRKQVQCTICGKLLSSKFRLKCHLRLHTGERPYKCDECQKSFAELNELKGHQRMHRGEIFACSTCNKAFITNRGLNKHLKIHTGHVRESIHVYRETVKRKVCEDALEIEEPDSVRDQTVHATLEGNCALNIKEVNKSELLEETVKNSKLNASDLMNSITRKKVQCTTCGILLSSKFRLKCHLRLHTGERPYKCDKCEKSFVEARYLKEHQRIHTGNLSNRKQFQCTICGRFLSTKFRMKCHLRLHSGERPYKCDKCEKSFVEVNYLKAHQRIHTGGRPFECEVRAKQLNQGTGLKSRFFCSVCKKAFVTKSNLSKHLKTHTVEIPDVRSVRGIKYATTSHLKRHMKTYNPEICEDALEIEEPHSVQDQTVHASVEENCELDITEVNESELLKETVKNRKRNESDLRSSKNQKQVQCTICGKLLSSKYILKCHLRLHTGEKPYKCDKCEKSYVEVHSLKVHRRIHTGEKPLKCKICEKKFNQGSGLRSHMRIHTRDWPYECHICRKRFKTQSPVRCHIQRQHMREKNFFCSTCNKAFITRSCLNSHLKIHSTEKPYECTVCGKKFEIPSYLKKHTMKAHAEENFRSEIVIIKGNS